MTTKIYGQSLSSLEILKRILGEDTIKVNNKNEVTFHNVNLLDDEGNKLLLFNSDSKKLRRKNKGEYKYLNYYTDCSKLIDFFLEQTNYEQIGFKEQGDKIHLFLRNNTNNKNVYEIEFDKEDKVTVDYYITKYIKSYLDNFDN